MTTPSGAATQQVIQHFQRIVQADGGVLELLDRRESVARFLYQPGKNAQCDTCVLSADDLRELMSEALHARDPSLTSVELTSDRQAIA